jgi:SAM-dependent methyltransferase
LKILDAGCAASFFIYELQRYGQVFGIDSRPYFENLPKAIKFIQGDILHMPFPENYFDCVTVISVIEHVGLGAYGDPIKDGGDFEAIQNLKRVLKKGGTLFLTTLIGNRYVIKPPVNERIYDKERLHKLGSAFGIVKEEYCIFSKKWIRVNPEEAFRQAAEQFGLACLQLKK